MSDYTATGTPPEVDMSAEGAARVAMEIQTLLSTPLGSLPLDRDFGIDWTLLDRPTPEVQAQLRGQIVQQVRRYVPLAAVTAVEFVTSEADLMDGRLIPVVRFKLIQ